MSFVFQQPARQGSAMEDPGNIPETNPEAPATVQVDVAANNLLSSSGQSNAPAAAGGVQPAPAVPSATPAPAVASPTVAARHCDHCNGSGTCQCAICDKAPGATCKRQHCDECRGLPGPCQCSKACVKPKYVACEPAKHCDHCPGNGICQCGICPQGKGCACKRMHCKHCKGLLGNCACTHGCAKPHYVRCNTVFHCTHCRGAAGTCMCPICPQPTGAKCIRQHCLHCKGLPGGACACTFNCPRPLYVTCMPARHCPHCIGRPPPAICECVMCPRVPGTLCKPAHCIHCRGFQGSCACPSGCTRRPYVMCTPASGAPTSTGTGSAASASHGLASSSGDGGEPKPPTL